MTRESEVWSVAGLPSRIPLATPGCEASEAWRRKMGKWDSLSETNAGDPNPGRTHLATMAQVQTRKVPSTSEPSTAIDSTLCPPSRDPRDASTRVILHAFIERTQVMPASSVPSTVATTSLIPSPVRCLRRDLPSNVLGLGKQPMDVPQGSRTRRFDGPTRCTRSDVPPEPLRRWPQRSFSARRSHPPTQPAVPRLSVPQPGQFLGWVGLPGRSSRRQR